MKDHFLFRPLNTQTQDIMNLVIKIFAVLDICATLIIGSIALFAPGLKVFIFQKEPTVLVLFLFVIILIILSARRFTQKAGVLIIRFLIGSLITIFILYTSYLFGMWYITNIEGVFTFRGFSFTKTASLEKKLEVFNLIINQMIDKTRIYNLDLALFLEKAAPIINPSTVKLISIPYSQIPDLALSIINEQTVIHSRLMEMAKSNAKGSHSSDMFYFIMKSLAVITLITLGGYVLYNYTNLHTVIKKGLNLLSNTQDEVTKLAMLSAKDSTLLATLNKDITSLIFVNTKLLNRIKKLELIVENHTYLINAVIRPSIQATFALTSTTINKAVRKKCLDTQTEEVRDFITLTSKLIFDQ